VKNVRHETQVKRLFLLKEKEMMIGDFLPSMNLI
jgi:hypothetical protein